MTDLLATYMPVLGRVYRLTRDEVWDLEERELANYLHDLTAG